MNDLLQVAVDAHGEEVHVDLLAELLARQRRPNRHLVAVAVEHVDVGRLLPGDGRHFLALGAQPRDTVMQIIRRGQYL